MAQIWKWNAIGEYATWYRLKTNLLMFLILHKPSSKVQSTSVIVDTLGPANLSTIRDGT